MRDNHLFLSRRQHHHYPEHFVVLVSVPPYHIAQIERLQAENRSLLVETGELRGQLEALAMGDRQPANTSISVGDFKTRTSDERYAPPPSPHCPPHPAPMGPSGLP